MHKCWTEKHINNLILYVMENSVACILYSYLAAEAFDNFCLLIAVWSSVVLETDLVWPPFCVFSVSLCSYLGLVSSEFRVPLQWVLHLLDRVDLLYEHLKIFCCPFFTVWLFCRTAYAEMLLLSDEIYNHITSSNRNSKHHGFPEKKHQYAACKVSHFPTLLITLSP